MISTLSSSAVEANARPLFALTITHYYQEIGEQELVFHACSLASMLLDVVMMQLYWL